MKYFLDTEFIENGSTIDLISLGMVAEDGRTLYFQNTACEFSKASDWVWRNVFPHLIHFDFSMPGRSCARKKVDDFNNKGGRCTGVGRKSCCWRDKHESIEMIKSFLDVKIYGVPEIWAYYASYDWVAFCQIFGKMDDLPKEYPMYCKDLQQFADSLGNPVFDQQTLQDQHNALSDALWNFEYYKFLVMENRHI